MPNALRLPAIAVVSAVASAEESAAIGVGTAAITGGELVITGKPTTGTFVTLDDLAGDQWVRSEVYDAIQGVFANYDLLVTPTLGAMPVKNRGNGNTMGPTHVNGVEVDPLIGWCLTYPINFTGHPAASIPAGMIDGLPVGMQIIGRRYADANVFAASAPSSN